MRYVNYFLNIVFNEETNHTLFFYEETTNLNNNKIKTKWGIR